MALQKQTLTDAGVKSQWHQTIEDVPSGPSIIIGNEFLDALPIRQWVKDGDHWKERCVNVIDDRFELHLAIKLTSVISRKCFAKPQTATYWKHHLSPLISFRKYLHVFASLVGLRCLLIMVIRQRDWARRCKR